VVIHHIEMNDVGACGNDISYLFPQSGEVGRQDAGSDEIFGHGRVPFERAPNFNP
jgi:hypothetical protein